VPPPRDANGDWQITGLDSGAVTRFKDGDDQLLGFAPIRSVVCQEQALSARLSPLPG
jgi:hypothetical protein